MRYSVLSLLVAMVFLDAAPIGTGGCSRRDDDNGRSRAERPLPSENTTQDESPEQITPLNDSIQ